MVNNQNHTDHVLCSQRWRSFLQLAKTKLGVDSGSDHELLIAKFSLKLKKVGEIIKPFRYDLNQMLYTVEMMNRFKGLDLVDRVCEGLWTEVNNIIQEAMTKSIPKKNKFKKEKEWSETLQLAEKRREAKGKEKERERYTQLNVEFQRIARREKKAFLNEQCKETGRTIEWERLEISQENWRYKGTFHTRKDMIKDRNSKDITEAEEIKKRWQECTELLKWVLI